MFYLLKNWISAWRIEYQLFEARLLQKFEVRKDDQVCESSLLFSIILWKARSDRSCNLRLTPPHRISHKELPHSPHPFPDLQPLICLYLHFIIKIIFINPNLNKSLCAHINWVLQPGAPEHRSRSLIQDNCPRPGSSRSVHLTSPPHLQ